MVKKAHQNHKGGLNAADRAHFKRTEGANIKSPRAQSEDGKGCEAAQVVRRRRR